MEKTDFRVICTIHMWENNGWVHKEQNVEKVCKIINKDLKSADRLGLSCNTGQQILKEILNMQ